MQSSVTHLAQHGHQGSLPGRDAPKSHPTWFSVVSEVLTKVENHFQLLTKLNENCGCTNDKVVHTKYIITFSYCGLEFISIIYSRHISSSA